MLKRQSKFWATLLVVVLMVSLLPAFNPGVAMAAEDPYAGGVWLTGDHHMHTTASDGSESVAYDVYHAKQYGLDFIAITNHGGTGYYPKIEAEYQEVVTQRVYNPDLLIFQGFEWNVPDGEHATFMVTPEENELDQVLGFMSQYDQSYNPAADTVEEAVAALVYAEQMDPQPLVLLNHPSRKGLYSIDEIRAYEDAGNVAVGFEGAPGHQANPTRGSYPGTAEGSSRTYGGYDKMTAEVGGLWDTLLAEGREWFITANSDFHKHYSAGGDDMWPGEYSKTYVWATDKDYEPVMDSLRNGRSFTVQGDLIDALEFTAATDDQVAILGDTLAATQDDTVTVTIKVRDPQTLNNHGDNPKLQQVQLISNASGTPAITEVFTAADWEEQGDYLVMEHTFTNVSEDFYVRVRGSNTDEENPAEDPEGENAWEDLWFYSNPIFITTTTEEEPPVQPGQFGQVLVNASFEQPGTNGTEPANWTPVYLDNEIKPYKLNFWAFNLSGEYPPPAPVPDGDFAVEVFYQVGSDSGVIGAGGEQTKADFGVVDQTTANTLSYNVVQTSYANPQSASWGGAVAEVEFTSGGETYKLRYFHEFSANYSGQPTDTGNIKYKNSTPFTGNEAWIQDSHNLTEDIKSLFGVDEFTVEAVRIANLVNRTAATPYPNSTTYWDKVELTKEEEVEVPGFDLTILHTNDTHAHLDDIARRATLIESVRESVNNALLVDAGDVFSGTLYFTQWQGQADLEFMNLLDYDAMGLGNHEFDKGPQTLAEFVYGAQFPIVNANFGFSNDEHLSSYAHNTIGDATAAGGIWPAVIREVGGEQVGIIGLTTEDTAEISSPGDDITINDAFIAAGETVAALEQAGVNKIIVLSHLGWNRDLELAAEVEGIDVIVGGHSHTLPEPDAYPTVVAEDATPTLVVQAGENGAYLGRLDVTFDDGGVVVAAAATGELLAVDKNVEEDKEFKTLIDGYNEQLEDIQNQVVGETQVILDGERAHVRNQETNLGNLIADAMLAKAREAGATIAITNGGGIRASIEVGEITLGEVLTVMPYGNTLMVTDLTGAQIKAALENGVSQVNLEDPGSSPGRFPQVAGLRFTWDPTQPVGKRIQGVEAANAQGGYTPIDPEATYTVATNNFMYNGGDGYTVFTEGQNPLELGFVDYEVLVEYLEANSPVNPQVEGRILTASPSPDGKPFAITEGQLDRTSGIKATINVNRTGATEHEGEEVVVFQLMAGNTPVSIVALQKDIQQTEKLIAHFNKTGNEFWVKTFVFDEFNSDPSSVQTNLAEAQVLE